MTLRVPNNISASSNFVPFNSTSTANDPKLIYLQSSNQPIHSTVRPVTIDSNNFSNSSQYQNIVPHQQQIISSNLMMNTKQSSLTQPYFYPHSQSIGFRPGFNNQSSYVIQKPKIVQQVKIVKRPEVIVQGQPEIQTVIKYQKSKEPPVQFNRQSTWQSYYSNKKAILRPPTPAFAEQPKCNNALLWILGFLALAGLITGIVLAAKAQNGYGQVVDNTNHSEGTAQKIQNIISASNSNSIQEKSSSKQAGIIVRNTRQPLSVDPIKINPEIVQQKTIQVGSLIKSSDTNPLVQDSSQIVGEDKKTGSFNPSTTNTTISLKSRHNLKENMGNHRHKISI